MADANNAALRRHLVTLLEAEHAHVGFERAVKNLPAHLRGDKPAEVEHSAWELLEHMRIAQWDILEFSRDPQHVSPEWPDEYWPKQPAPPSERAWDDSVHRFLEDRKAMVALANDESLDLFARIPHGEGQTLLREVLLVADHNSYHLGQLVALRKVLGAW